MKRNIISPGDFVDLYYKGRQKGLKNLITKLGLSHRHRAASKWDTETQPISAADFWIIPEIQQRWNRKITGNPQMDYSDYVIHKYFSEASSLKMLSIGSGTGREERKFAKHPQFESILGMDIAKERVKMAQHKAQEEGLDKINYIVDDFNRHNFIESFDLILFHSSLHHLKHVAPLLAEKVPRLLTKEGCLVIHEYVGPNRLQYRSEQLHLANSLLRELPKEYKMRFSGKVEKRRAYRPGWLRMLLNDPSEAVDAEAIAPSLHRYYQPLEEKNLGGNIAQLLFKDIAHHFLKTDRETHHRLVQILDREDRFVQETGQSDYIFGVYKKK